MNKDTFEIDRSIAHLTDLSSVSYIYRNIGFDPRSRSLLSLECKFLYGHFIN